MQPDSWAIFHDGTIKNITGQIPGDITINLEIEYLREMFEGTGQGFNIKLKNCSAIEYTDFDDGQIHDPREIVQREPIILYVKSENPVVLDCTSGTLCLHYESAEVTLDSNNFLVSEGSLQNSEFIVR